MVGMNQKTMWLVLIAAVVIIILIASFSLIQKPEELEKEVTEPEEGEEIQPEKEEVPTQIILVTDTENHRIQKINLDGEVVWQYGCKSINNLGKCDFGSGDNQLLKPKSALIYGKNVLITDYENHRVIELNENKEVIWEYGEGVSGFGSNQLWYPMFAQKLDNGNYLISDGLNNRVIEVDSDKELIWQYGCSSFNSAGKCAYGTEADELRNPAMAIRLDNGNTLITDSENNRVIEVTPQKEIVWELSKLSIPQSAVKLDNGNYLVTDYRNRKVIEITNDKEIAWQYDGIFSSYAVKLANGNYLITDNQQNKITEMSPDKEIVWEYGSTFGTNEGQLGHARMAVIS